MAHKGNKNFLHFSGSIRLYSNCKRTNLRDLLSSLYYVRKIFRKDDDKFELNNRIELNFLQKLRNLRWSAEQLNETDDES